MLLGWQVFSQLFPRVANEADQRLGTSHLQGSVTAIDSVGQQTRHAHAHGTGTGTSVHVCKAQFSTTNVVAPYLQNSFVPVADLDCCVLAQLAERRQLHVTGVGMRVEMEAMGCSLQLVVGGGVVGAYLSSDVRRVLHHSSVNHYTARDEANVMTATPFGQRSLHFSGTPACGPAQRFLTMLDACTQASQAI